MDVTHHPKRSLSDKIRGFFLLCHPGPVLFHIIAVTVFTLLAAWPNLFWLPIALVIAAHTAMQLSIAMLNDYCDRELDAQGKPGKPIPRGLVTPREALMGGRIMIILMLIFLMFLPPLALLISLCYLALGQAYNWKLKSTPFSGIVFALAMPLIPLYAFAGMGRPLPILFWLVPVGFMIGIAINLANSLPDLEEDAAHHARTLAVVLGVKGSFLACQSLIVASAALIALVTMLGFVRIHIWILVVTLIIACVAVEGMHLFFGPEKPVKTRKLYFYLVTLTCLILAGGWLIGVLA